MTKKEIYYNVNYQTVRKLMGYNETRFPNVVKQQYENGLAEHGQTLSEYPGSVLDILGKADEELVDMMFYFTEAADRVHVLPDILPLLNAIIELYKVTHEKIRPKKDVLRVSSAE